MLEALLLAVWLPLSLRFNLFTEAVDALRVVLGHAAVMHAVARLSFNFLRQREQLAIR